RRHPPSGARRTPRAAPTDASHLGAHLAPALWIPVTCPHRRVIDAEWPRASRAGHAHHGAPFFLIAPEKTIQPVQGWLPVHLQDSGERGEKRGPRAPRHVAR